MRDEFRGIGDEVLDDRAPPAAYLPQRDGGIIPCRLSNNPQILKTSMANGRINALVANFSDGNRSQSLSVLYLLCYGSIVP
jgi:hypothetical protein